MTSSIADWLRGWDNGRGCKTLEVCASYLFLAPVVVRAFIEDSNSTLKGQPFLRISQCELFGLFESFLCCPPSRKILEGGQKIYLQ